MMLTAMVMLLKKGCGFFASQLFIAAVLCSFGLCLFSCNLRLLCCCCRCHLCCCSPLLLPAVSACFIFSVSAVAAAVAVVVVVVVVAGVVVVVVAAVRKIKMDHKLGDTQARQHYEQAPQAWDKRPSDAAAPPTDKRQRGEGRSQQPLWTGRNWWESPDSQGASSSS